MTRIDSVIVNRLSRHSVDQTVERSGLLCKDVALFALIDHSDGEADKAGMKIKPMDC